MKKKIAFMKRENVVLTERHKEAVQTELLKIQKKVKKIWNVDVEIPVVTYDLKSRGVCGLAIPSRNHLRFHPIYLCENEKDYIENTVGHEFAHIIVHHTHKVAAGKKKMMPHGDEWREVMVKLGIGPKAGQDWDYVIKHHYNPSSIEQKPKRSYGPRKPGGRTVGELMLKINKLKPEELAALKQRLGVEGGEVVTPKPLSPHEIKAWQESQRLSNLLDSKYSHVETSAVSTSGWAHSVILELEKK